MMKQKMVFMMAVGICLVGWGGTTQAAITAGASIVVDYNQASDINDFLVIRDDTPSTGTLWIAQDAAKGVGTPASGGVEVINVGTTNGSNDIAVLYAPGGVAPDGAISMNPGDLLTLSLKFKTWHTDEAATPRLGIASFSDVAAATTNWTVTDINAGKDIIGGTNNNNYADGIATNVATAGDKTFNIADVVGGGGRTFTADPGGPYMLTNDTWYQFILEITKSETADQFEVASTLNRLNADGTALDSQIGYVTATLTNADLYADDVIAGFTVVHDGEPDTVTNEYDDLSISLVKPVFALNPDPDIGEPDVDPAIALKWDTGDDPLITHHLVYLSNGVPTDEPNLYLVATLPVATTQYDPSGPWELQRDRKYNWRIDEQAIYPGGDDPNLFPGKLWWFETAPSTPSVGPVTPAVQYVDLNATAQFSIAATNPFTGDSTGLAYQWYQGAPGDTSNPVGTDNDTLTIANAQVSDDGEYYCQVTITANQASGDSTSGYLVVKRRVGWWKLDGNMNDSENSYHGTYVDPNAVNPPPTPIYTTGVDGTANGAFEFVNQEIEGGGKYILMPEPNEFNFYPQGYTASAWIKTTEGNYGAAVAKQDRTAPWRGFLLNHNGANAINTLRQVAAVTSQGVTVNDGQWHLITSTYNRQTGMLKLYVDGKFNNEAGPNFSQADTHSEPLIFGAGEVTGQSSPYEGILDDVQIWNYELDPVTIAYLFTDLNQDSDREPLCVEEMGGLEYDFNNDCTVDLLDFAMFASDWLNCDQVPNCIPRP